VTCATLEYCAVEGGRLAYEDLGDGPPLILLHGFSFDHHAWDRQVGRLAAVHRVIRYDLRGFGRSSIPTGEYGHGEDLGELISHLGIVDPVLVGLSLGANVALAYALDHPGGVRGLVLASPGLPGFFWDEVRPPDAAAAHARLHGVDSAREFWLDSALFAPLRRDPTLFAPLARMVGRYHGWHWRHPNPVRMPPVLERLPRCDVPALILSGDLDVAGYRRIAAKLGSEMAASRVLRFPDAGHVLNDEADLAFVTAVIEFARAPGGDPPTNTRRGSSDETGELSTRGS